MKCYQNDNLLHVNVTRDVPNYAHFGKWKKTVKNITRWHKTLSVSVAKVNKFQIAV